MNKTIVQSHRVAGVTSPEDILQLFQEAWSKGYIPEADVRTTRDGVIVDFHDANFVRVIKDAYQELQRQGVQDFAFDEIAALDADVWKDEAGNRQRVCRIDGLFDALAKRADKELYLDIKKVNLPQLAELARQFDVEKRVILAAPQEADLREWKTLIPEGQTLLWMGGDEESLRNRFAALRETDFAGITQLQIHVRLIEGQFQPSLDLLREVADELIARGILFQALPWDVDDAAAHRALLGAGVQSFASDYPQVALEALHDWHRVKVLSVKEALQAARETKTLRIGEDILATVPEVFKNQFGDQPAAIIADTTTWRVAGEAVQKYFQRKVEPFIFTRQPHAEMEFVEELESALKRHEAIPVAVGSGVINDLVKLAAHRVERPYMCVATADSMDGYTAFGASITFEGSKQTFTCPAPAAVVADLKVLSEAPPAMTASGYADLHAKVTAGADWIVADALGVEPIDPMAWNIVQGKLAESLANPLGAAEGEKEAISLLTEGLMLGGFAMQWSRSSRPASGAEHQFSHLWDMQHHTQENGPPSHGFKVGIGTLAVTALYEFLLQQPFDQLDVEECCAQWPGREEAVQNARELLGDELADLGERETLAKYSDAEELRLQLLALKNNWPEIRKKLQSQLVPFEELRQRLQTVGAPFEPEQIGISRARLRRSYYQAACIRRRFTVFDLALRTGTLDAALAHIFGPQGRWLENV
jgi:glycerol-1-phosphate dehydrogenase [NAD(P)+]